MNPSEDQIESNLLFGIISSGAERLSLPQQHQSIRTSNSSHPMEKDGGHHADDGDSKQVSKKMTPLPQAFVPGENDVICGRGRNIWNSVGNVRFRRIVENRVDEYSAAKTKLDKSAILSSIVTDVRRTSPNGGFVKKDSKTKEWHEVSTTWWRFSL
jgi:hypothetical protein